jgi:hypothetical protein
MTDWYTDVASYPVRASATRRFTFSPTTPAQAQPLLAAGPHRLYQELLTDQESELTHYLARVVLEAFLGEPADHGEVTAAGLTRAREELHARLDRVLAEHPTGRGDVLRERAPLSLLGDCWLATVSQPATQPAPVVNDLFRLHFANRGRGDTRDDQVARRRQALAAALPDLPHPSASDFLQRCSASALTAWQGVCYLALSRLPGTFLPELIGLHWAHHELGIDDHLLGLAPTGPKPDVHAVVRRFCAESDQQVLARLHRGADLAIALEREHVALLGELADQSATASLDARVVRVIARHAAYAGRQHRSVTVGGTRLTDLLPPDGSDPVALMRALRSSRQVKPMRGGVARFLRAIRFGGPMFGIFDADEAALFEQWIDAISSGVPADPEPVPPPLGEAEAARYADAVATARPDDVVFEEVHPLDDRELLHRLVNIERYPHVRALAREHAEVALAEGEVLFEHGAAGRYTDASLFDYSPAALLERVERIYWDKLVEPYRPLREIPDRDTVVFGQRTFALGSLIDGAWAHRIGGVGRYDAAADQKLFAIYADEMGRGDPAKNHVSLIYRVLASMAIELPHIADPAFRDQDELPDSLYGFSLHQLALALFPDTLREEILGYNLGIEMFGLGELRLHEMEKLRHHGLDDCYEQAHLSIDNLSAGHARQSAEIVIAHLDAVRHTSGAAAVEAQWRRIWRGYASFAHFVEHELVATLRTGDATPDAAVTI